jgi:hypothetical protein
MVHPGYRSAPNDPSAGLCGGVCAFGRLCKVLIEVQEADAFSLSEERETEMTVLCDPEWREWLQQHNIELASFDVV